MESESSSGRRTTGQLLEELDRLYEQLDQGIQVQVSRLKQDSARFGGGWPTGTEYRMVDPNGRPLLLDALTAKANVLSAMANLKAASLAACPYHPDGGNHPEVGNG